MGATLHYGMPQGGLSILGRGLVNASTDGEPGSPGMQQDIWPTLDTSPRRGFVLSLLVKRPWPLQTTHWDLRFICHRVRRDQLHDHRHAGTPVY